MNVTPTGMVPNEDTGTIMGAVTLPPGTSQERTIEVMNKVDSLIAADRQSNRVRPLLVSALSVARGLHTVRSLSS